jgi:hypothetical protein
MADTNTTSDTPTALPPPPDAVKAAAAMNAQNQPTPVIQPVDEATIPPALLSMGGSGIDNSLNKLLQAKAQTLVPQALKASADQAKTDAEAAKAEALEDQAYREKIAELYKNYKPDTVDFGGRPNAPEENPLKQFGSLASMLGIFASAFTKQPIVNALNASASAMNAAKASDMEAYNNAYKAWQDGIKNSIEKTKLDHDALADALDIAKTDNGLAIAKIKAYAAEKNWPAAAILAQTGDMEQIAQLAKSLDTAAGKMNNFKSFLLNEGVQEFIAKNKRPPTFDELTKINQAAEGKDASTAEPMDNDSVDLLARQWLATSNIPSLGYGKDAIKLKRQIIARAAEIEKESGEDMGDIIANRAGIKADASSLNKIQSMTDSATAYENTAMDNMKIVESLMNKGEGTSAGPVINRWIQAGRVATGDPDVKALDDAIRTVAGEYAKVMSGSMGNAPATEGARAEANQMISVIDSPEAIHEVFDQVMRPDMENKKNNYNGQITAIKKRIKGSSSAQLPDAAVKQLKEGVHTTFKNGQTWTLQNGQPVQVQ